VFWWKILNNLVRIHSALYRWAINVNIVGENYGFATGAHVEIFLGVGADPEGIYNLCLILKIMF
jgi:Na+/glutamate symporter